MAIPGVKLVLRVEYGEHPLVEGREEMVQGFFQIRVTLVVVPLQILKVNQV